MIKRWKMIECSLCYQKEVMRKTSKGWDLPLGWKQINRKTHFCPYCDEAIYSYGRKHGDEK